MSSYKTIRGESQLNLGSRSIGPVLLSKASSIFVFGVSYNLIMIFVLSITDYQIDSIDILFEHVSAFSTTGLSTGVTSQFSKVGQSILMLSMFVGRVGSLTLLLALSNKRGVQNFSYPKAHLFIG